MGYITMSNQYFFYGKSDTKKEPIGKTEAKTMADAIAYFATVKNLAQDKFMELFAVEAQN